MRQEEQEISKKVLLAELEERKTDVNGRMKYMKMLECSE